MEAGCTLVSPQTRSATGECDRSTAVQCFDIESWQESGFRMYERFWSLFYMCVFVIRFYTVYRLSRVFREC